jgi:hypothetical protein
VRKRIYLTVPPPPVREPIQCRMVAEVLGSGPRLDLEMMAG